MSDQNDECIARIVAEARQLVGDIQGRFDAEDDFFRQHGLNPDEARGALMGCLEPSMAELADELVGEDLTAIKHEVGAAAARLSLTSPATGARARKPRMMI